MQGDGFLKRVRARDELTAVEALDVPCMLAQEQVGERIMHMVRVGPFDTKDEANDALDKLTEAGISVRLLR